MRLYYDGKLSNKKQRVFTITRFYFANPNEEYETDTLTNCIALEGHSCESSVKKDIFFGRWKGVDLVYYDENGQWIEKDEFTIEELEKMIGVNGYKLVDIEAVCNSSMNVEIDWIEIEDNTGEQLILSDFNDVNIRTII